MTIGSLIRLYSTKFTNLKWNLNYKRLIEYRGLVKSEYKKNTNAVLTSL